MATKQPDSYTSDINADKCPVCLTEKYLNPNLKLLVSPCFHKMYINRCKHKHSGDFTYQIPLTKKSHSIRSTGAKATFEDLRVEKEVQIRKRISRIFNKRLEDFRGDPEAYNKYLEMVEDTTFNLVNAVDVEETEAYIQQYTKDNKDTIDSNQRKQQSEEKHQKTRLERERREKLLRKEAYLQAEEENEKAKALQEAEILNSLASDTTKTPEDIIRENKQKQKHRRHHAGQIDIKLEPEIDIMDVEDGKSVQVDDFDPFDGLYFERDYTKVEDSYHEQFTSDVVKDQKAKAGGYLPRVAYERAISAMYFGILAPAPA
ncbi:TFIIH/NER complex subunit [Rhizophlyctis rosea]|uniref:RNA polymerase II transcription factor B subunit 3 n=1 Tax=Rhizophlyctis rosea TaxID=64517 RepID=A0AAD5SEF8_9FUNG|nr:TFIIH/NER complex subunit [Rhizophlyctis rosea]